MTVGIMFQKNIRQYLEESMNIRVLKSKLTRKNRRILDRTTKIRPWKENIASTEKQLENKKKMREEE